MKHALKIEILDKQILFSANLLTQCMISQNSHLTDDAAITYELNHLFDSYNQTFVGIWVHCLQTQLPGMAAIRDQGLEWAKGNLTIAEGKVSEKMQNSFQDVFGHFDNEPDWINLSWILRDILHDTLAPDTTYLLSDPELQKEVQEKIDSYFYIQRVQADAERMDKELRDFRRRAKALH